MSSVFERVFLFEEEEERWAAYIDAVVTAVMAGNSDMLVTMKPTNGSKRDLLITVSPFD